MLPATKKTSNTTNTLRRSSTVTPGHNAYKKLLLLLICAGLTLLTTARAKPTLSFQLPTSLTIPSFSTSFSQYVERKQAEKMKTFSGKRLDERSLRMIYFHDQTIAIVELGPHKLLIGCELIEIYNEKEGNALLRELSKINRPFEISLRDMLKLMSQCEQVDGFNETREKKNVNFEEENEQDTNRGIFSVNPISLFSGIIPGTKWCGTGDIADTYYDLGADSQMDRCCRTHDLCPLKIRAYQKKYKLYNNSLYTKSHCTCDDMLYSCLKATNTSAAQVMGSIYFNLVQVPCVEEPFHGQYKFRQAREGF